MTIKKVITPGGRVGDDSPLDRSPKKNWVEERGGLPKYVRMVAHAFVRKGMSMSRAISMAIGVIRNWAEGKGNVTPKVRAAAAAAIAQWEAMKVSKSEDIVTKLLVDQMFEEITKSLCCPHNMSVMKSGCPICEHSKEDKKKKKIKKRDFSQKKRDELKAKGKTDAHGGFPLEKPIDVKNAVRAIGRAKNPEMEKKRIVSAAKKMGCMQHIPDTWNVSKALTISKEEFENLVAEIDADAEIPDEFYAQGEIEKSDADKQLVFGWCSIAKGKDGKVVVDKQGDVLEDIDQMEKVAYDFVLHSRDGGEMHVRKGVSTLVESFMSTPEKWAAMGIPEGTLPVGWWVGFKVNDPVVWKAVKDGKYKMFSVHGSGLRKALD